jgi:type I restriction enzyme S subunit
MKGSGSSQLIPHGYKQTEVGVIPEEWEVKHLRDVAQIRSGIAKNANSSITDPVFVHYLRVANVQDGFLDLSDMSQLEVSRSDLQRFSVLPGDVLMNEGGDRDKLGRGSIWKGQFQPCVHQNHVFVVRCGRSVLPEYLTIWSAFSTARKFFLLAGKQTTNLASINKTSLGELPVPLPRENEQRAIATALSDVDALLSWLERLIAKKRDLKHAAMQQLLTGQTRLPGFHGEWEVKRLGDMLTICHGKNQRDVEESGGMYPILATGGQIGTSSRALYDKPSVLIGRKGTINQPRYMDTPFWTVDTLFYSAMKGDNNAKFLYYRFCLIDWMQFNEASGVPSLSARTIENVEVSVPVSAEQTAIAAVLSDMDAELAALEARRAKTRDLKQAMMQELLTGRTRLV